MNTICVTELENADFLIKAVGATLQTYWQSGSVWNSLSRPRRTQAFLYAKGCAIKYIFADGRRLSLKKGEAVYVPRGFSYKAVFENVELSRSTLLINFDLELEGHSVNLLTEPTVLPPRLQRRNGEDL